MKKLIRFIKELLLTEYNEDNFLHIDPYVSALRIALYYTVFGILWILLSDRLLEWFVSSPEQFQRLSLFKGWFFIFLTASLLYFLTLRHFKILHYLSRDLYNNYEELLATEEDLKEKFIELEQSQKVIKSSEQRFKLVLEALNDGVWDWNYKTNSIYYSRKWKNNLGYADSEFVSSLENWKASIHPDDRPYVLDNLNNYLTRKIERYNVEYRIKAGNGQYKWVASRGKAVWDSQNNPVRVVGSTADITERKTFEKKIMDLAYFDQVTFTPNRASLEETFLTQAIEYDKKVNMALIYLDIDNFKMINDTLGHTMGDHLLADIALTLKEFTPHCDMISRLSGDEFALLISDYDSEDTLKVLAKEILKSLRRPWILSGREFYISGSIGISTYPNHGHDFDTLLKKADTAMYYAKDNGRDQCAIFDELMHVEMLEYVDLQNSMMRGLENGEFVLHYQPQLDLNSKTVIGAEALIRWHHPDRGLIPPVKFIHIAEKTGFIRKLGQWVIHDVCRQMNEWRDKGLEPINISINLSAVQIMHDAITDDIMKILDQHDIDPKWITFEITENAAIEDIETTIKKLNILRDKQLKIALDDFGTRYSSLTYLRKLPIDAIKLDKSFISTIDKNKTDRSISEATIRLAHDMDLDVVAEGIETIEHLDILKDIHCNKGQGYLFSRPIEAEVFEELYL